MSAVDRENAHRWQSIVDEELERRKSLRLRFTQWLRRILARISP